MCECECIEIPEEILIYIRERVLIFGLYLYDVVVVVLIPQETNRVSASISFYFLLRLL